jgi:hypothetical protein
MPKLIYSNLEEIPESARFRAVQTPQGFEVDAAPLLENHAELQRQLQKFRTLAERAKDFDGIDPEKARHALEQWEQAEQFGRDVEKALEARDRQWKEREARLMQQVADGQIDEAIRQANGIPKVLRYHIRPMVQPEWENGSVVLRVVDKNGSVQRDPASGRPLTVNDVIQRFRKDPDFDTAFQEHRATASPWSPVPSSSSSAAPPSTPFQSTARKIRLTRQQAHEVQFIARLCGRRVVTQAGWKSSRSKPPPNPYAARFREPAGLGWPNRWRAAPTMAIIHAARIANLERGDNQHTAIAAPSPISQSRCC